MFRSSSKLIKSTIVAGLFVLLPVLLLILVLTELFGLVVVLATPIADLFPAETFDRLPMHELLAVLLILGASMVLGLIAHLPMSKAIGAWIERQTLDRVPIYVVLKQLSRRMVDAEFGTAFRPALLDVGDGAEEIVYAMEQTADGRITVLIPRAPAGFAGQIRVVRPERVRLLDASLAETTKVIGQWGLGTGALIASPEDDGAAPRASGKDR
jgi:uncharacterized membrane protein